MASRGKNRMKDTKESALLPRASFLVFGGFYVINTFKSTLNTSVSLMLLMTWKIHVMRFLFWIQCSDLQLKKLAGETATGFQLARWQRLNWKFTLKNQMLMTAHYQRFQAHRKGSSWPAWPCFSLLGDLEKGLQLGPQHPPNALVFIGPRFHCVYVPWLLYPIICQWTSRLLPCSLQHYLQ